MSRLIDSVVIRVTTACNYSCVECAVDVPRIRPGVHESAAYLAHAGKMLHGIECVRISGGEPTIHPQFRKIAKTFRRVFGCKRLVLETNAAKVEQCADVLDCFDTIVAGYYDPDRIDGCGHGNKEQIDWLVEFGKTHGVAVQVGNAVHEPRTNPGGSMCYRGRMGLISHTRGLLYPCCTGQGVPGATGIELTGNWREEITDIPMPCATCFLAGT